MTIQVVVSGELLEEANQVASRQNVSVEQLAALALEQLLEWERLKQRAAQGSHERYLAFLDRVPNVPPDPADRLAPWSPTSAASSRTAPSARPRRSR